jgi:hypothetical protein
MLDLIQSLEKALESMNEGEARDRVWDHIQTLKTIRRSHQTFTVADRRYSDGGIAAAFVISYEVVKK